MPTKFEPRIDRFMRHVVIVESTDCWIWQRSKTPEGYGHFSLDKRRQCYAHRWAFEYFKGPIPSGLSIDHLCNQPSCVNPDHLAAVPIRENVLRGNNPCAQNARRTHCAKGHPLSADNLYKSPKCKHGRGTCRVCNLARVKAWRAARAV